MNLATAPKFYPLVDFVFTKMIPKSILEAVKTHTEFVNKSIEKRMSWDTSRPDFMTPMLKDNVNFENMTLGEIQSNFAIIIVAGSETTATTLCGILNYITRSEYSSVFEKVVREARKKFKQEKDITVESTKDLTYLHAVLNEGLRLCNPVPGGLMRTSAPGGDVYSGVFVPGNTTMAVRPYVMNRSPSLFARPSEFVPERWLSDSERPKEFAGDRLNSSRPFSTGHHACLGKPLAWVEMRLLLTRFLWAFDICQEEGKVLDWDDQQMIIMIHKEPFYLRIKAR